MFEILDIDKMNLFINDTPVKFVKGDEPIDSSVFDCIVRPNSVINLKELTGNVLIDDVAAPQVRQMINQLVEEPFNETRFVIRPHNYKEAKADFMSLFKVMNAAGGVVQKDNKDLLIYRLGKWDFPKGKLEKGEPFKLAAIREVEEETGVKVTLGKKICTTWHTYTFRKKRILKCTKWYAMDCVTDEAMAPQEDESIERVEWFDRGEAQNALNNTYNSIRFVWECYLGIKY
ncbi:Bis(5'-nucleosyl)-tetraphosphatase (Asymmetrical) [hydrothermal vent metagenome]|uniref:Bis(5'-nucleosyl)-tetraphosphatase (Asymmetrical) n=1 Tax=hydrothermal vent metagenome TaxID=652676 RepID=A0A3B0UW97_9ZZZZ